MTQRRRKVFVRGIGAFWVRHRRNVMVFRGAPAGIGNEVNSGVVLHMDAVLMGMGEL
jgi:hypothetical protein